MEVTRLSSRDVPARDRLAVFMDVYAAIEQVDVVLHEEAPPSYDVAMRALPGMTVLDARSSSGESRRTGIQARDGKDDLVLTVITDGNVIFMPHRGNELDLARGEGYLGFNDRPSHHKLHEPGFLDIAVERDTLAPLIGDVDRAGRGKLCRSPELALLTNYARLLVRETGELSPELASRCATHLLDLTVVALGGRHDAAEIANGRGARQVRFAAIKADIAANAANPEFSLEWLARRHGLRPRRIRDLFYAEGTGYSDFVLNTRLDLARAALADPSGAGRNIAEIALSCGFSDLSWFNRTFRRRFAMTPSEARETAATASKTRIP